MYRFFKQNRYRCVAHRKKIYGVEIDFIFEKQNIISFVEVKSLQSLDRLQYRLSYKQKNRLLRARLWFENQYSIPTETLLAVSTCEDQVHTFLVT